MHESGRSVKTECSLSIKLSSWRLAQLVLGALLVSTLIGAVTASKAPPLRTPGLANAGEGRGFMSISGTEPDFEISSEPSFVSVWQGSSNSSTISVRSVNGFNSSVSLLSVWSWPVPFGVTVDLPSTVVPPADGFGTAKLTVTAGPNATTGDFVLTVIGDSGTPEHELRHTLDVPVSISTAVTAADDFKIVAHPPSVSLANRGPGTSATTEITVQSVGTFSSPVVLTASGEGLTLAFTDTGTPETTVTPPAGGEASRVLTVGYASMASLRWSVIVTGSSGLLTHTVTLPVQVAIVDCLIAVATYGSELSPEVQFLRSFRDGSILKTRTGSSFMVAFNAWYYSFSPTVAQLINEHSTLRTVTKLALCPLIRILRLGSAAFHFFPTSLEASAVLSGLVVSSLLGVVYLAFPVAGVLAYSSTARRTAQRLQTSVAVTLVGAFVVVAITTVVGGPVILMTLATSTLVLGSVVVSTLLASRVILRLLKRV